jgi:hypothetical protein
MMINFVDKTSVMVTHDRLNHEVRSSNNLRKNTALSATVPIIRGYTMVGTSRNMPVFAGEESVFG